MIKNYFRIVVQNIIRHKAFTLINILGLSIGIACSILVMIWVNHEVSYDRYHKNIDRIGQIFDKSLEDGEVSWTLPYPLATAIKNEIPEVDAACLYLNWRSKNFISNGEKQYNFSFDYAQNDFFNIFSFDFVEGSKQTALLKENSIVITQRTAHILFGDESAIGRKLEYKKRFLEVSGVIKDNPTNSQFQFDILSNIHFLSLTGWDIAENKWNTSCYHLYVLLKDKVKPAVFEKKLNDIIKKNANLDFSVFYYPFKDVYLKSPLGDQLINRLRMFILGGFMLIIIACINYINLSTARYSQRLKEIGIRKITGARRSQIVQQHLGESLSYACISSYIGLLLADIFLPLFNYLTGNAFIFPWTDVFFWEEIVSLTLLIAFVTGLYPALILSSFQPVNALKNIIHRGHSGSLLRNSLVLIQFTCTIFFIICALVTAKQNIYLSNKDLGFNRNDIIYTSVDDTLIAKNFQVIKDELLKSPFIENVTRSRDVPFEYGSWSNDIAMSDVDYNFFDFFSISIASGSPFFQGRKYTSKDVIINEKLAQMLTSNSSEVDWLKNQNLNIVGVVKDYHIQSLRNPIKPLLVRNTYFDRYQLFVKHAPNKKYEAQELFRETIKRVSKESHCEIFSVNDMIKEAYVSDKQQLFTYIIFSIITIIISCLGLFGLTIYSVERREKEIGIRKANGATSFSIVVLLFTSTSKWIAYAFVLSIIPAYFFMRSWLNNFAYRTELNWWIFALAGLIASMLALFTVIWQSWRAANRNPVEALRYE